MIEVEIKTLIDNPEKFKKCTFCGNPNTREVTKCSTCLNRAKDAFEKWTKEDGINFSNEIGEEAESIEI